MGGETDGEEASHERGPDRPDEDRADEVPPLVDAARRLAEDLLRPVSWSRWQHTQAVAARAVQAAPVLPSTEKPYLIAAAWLHDIGYAASLRDSGFHPLDGARYLVAYGWPEVVAGLVAHHSGARFAAEVLGLGAELVPYTTPKVVSGPLADALTWADQTTGPTGEVMTVEDRLADVLRRHGPESPNARCHARRGPAVRAAVQATAARLRIGDRHGQAVGGPAVARHHLAMGTQSPPDAP